MKNKNWNKALMHIKAKIEDTAFQTWFEGLEVSMVTDDTITLLVPNRFHYEWLESKYRHLIHDALKDSFGNPMLSTTVFYYLRKAPMKYQVLREKENNIIPKGYNRSSNLNNRYSFENFIEEGESVCKGSGHISNR